jgi:mannose-1-phosphate guanylyltransferase
VRVTLIEEPVAQGNAGTVGRHRAFVAGDPSFFVLYADNFTTVDLDRLRRFHASHDGVLTMGLFRAPRPREAGIVTLGEGGQVTAFDEKPDQPAGDLANAGVYVARPALFDWIPDRPGVVDFGHDVLPRLMGRLYGQEVSGYLADIGTAAGLATVRAEWARGIPSGSRA